MCCLTIISNHSNNHNQTNHQQQLLDLVHQLQLWKQQYQQTFWRKNALSNSTSSHRLSYLYGYKFPLSITIIVLHQQCSTSSKKSVHCHYPMTMPLLNQLQKLTKSFIQLHSQISAEDYILKSIISLDSPHNLIKFEELRGTCLIDRLIGLKSRSYSTNINTSHSRKDDNIPGFAKMIVEILAATVAAYSFTFSFYQINSNNPRLEYFLRSCLSWWSLYLTTLPNTS